MKEAGRRGVERLLREAAVLQAEQRYIEAPRAAEEAVEGAVRRGDVGLEMRALDREADLLVVIGDGEGALVRYTRILGVAADPVRCRQIEEEGLEGVLAGAYSRWVNVASHLPQIPLDRLFEVLDAGEGYIRRIGHPDWCSGFRLARAKVLKNLGRDKEALSFAEEALALARRNENGHGFSLASHRSLLGAILRNLGRHDDARMQYQAVIDDGASADLDRADALNELARCTLDEGDGLTARKLAEEAVRLCVGTRDAPALEVLIEACLACGDLDAAWRASERMIDGARRRASDYDLYYALKNSAKVALEQKDAARARSLLDEAAPLADAFDRSRGDTTCCNEIQSLRARLVELELDEPKLR